MGKFFGNGYKHTHKFIYFRSFVPGSKERGRWSGYLPAKPGK